MLSLIIFILVFCDAIISIINSLVEVNLNPASLIVLLDLNRLLFKPLKFLKLADPLLERCFASIVKATRDDSTTDTE